ncbi:hypothetical protein KKC94_05970 [Patescibacteria group bacterium]|nr:hypothetical protein [Patescibacteria group bacterium]
METNRTAETTFYTHPSLGVFEVTISRYTDQYREKMKAEYEKAGIPTTPGLPDEIDFIDLSVKTPTGKTLAIRQAESIKETEEETSEAIREVLRLRLIRAKQHGKI